MDGRRRGSPSAQQQLSYRRTDPSTSRKAAKRIKAGSSHAKLLNTLRAAVFALTAEDMIVAAGLEHQRCPWKRVSELKALGLIQVVGEAVAWTSRPTP